MNAVPVAQADLRSPAEHSAPVKQTALHAVAIASPSLETTEVNRWIKLLTVPFLLSSAFFMATLSTGQLWLIGGALATGPGLLIMAFIHLALSSDTNGDL
ncbi:MAG TPA: hypothetical protein VG652_07615 [Gaiellaceae bacterium]|nr:hypothetical protein [Gaiellaceae bacterium]